AELVDVLLEQEDPEEQSELLGIGRDQRRLADLREIAAEIGGARPDRPETRPRLEGRTVLDADRRRRAEHGGVRRVIEGPEHPRDVGQRRPLAAPLAVRARRLAFEIDAYEIEARVEDLTEVEIALAANALRRELPPCQLAEEVQHRVLRLEHGDRVGPDRLGYRLQALAEQAVRAVRQVPHRLIARALVERGER